MDLESAFEQCMRDRDTGLSDLMHSMFKEAAGLYQDRLLRSVVKNCQEIQTDPLSWWTKQ